MKLWSELKRRRVVKTAIAYVIVAWIIVEGASTVFPSLLLPDWTVRLVVILAILGLPLVVILAWVFDIEVRQGTSGDDPAHETPAAGAISVTRSSQVLPSLKTAIASIAVLPFKNLSPDESKRFIADGIATELHSTLARVHRLRLASRTSSFSLANKELDVKEIASRLNVHFVICGSVECIGQQMRLIVELDNAEDGVQIWSRSYDRDLEDIFSIQQEIANAVASEFGAARLREEITSAARRPTSSLDAWSLVQRARSYTLSFTAKNLTEAVPLLNRAIELDADYAAAHAALASVMAEMVFNGFSQDVDGDRQTALDSAERASALTPLEPFVLKMCGAAWAYFGNPERSLDALRQAVEIAPFDFGAWGYMGWPLAATGSSGDLAELRRIMDWILEALPRHPGAPYWMYHRSVAHTIAGEYDEAIEFARKAVWRNPRFPWALMQYANALGMKKEEEAALEALDRCRGLSPGLTPEYYQSMVLGMCAGEQAAEPRLAGLRRLEILRQTPEGSVPAGQG